MNKFQFVEQDQIKLPQQTFKNLLGLIIYFLRINYVFLDRRGSEAARGY